jgi:hypothetical protein
VNRTAQTAVLAALVVALAALATPLRAQQTFNTTVYFDYVYFLTDDGPVTVSPLDNKFSFRRAYFTYENRWGDLRFRFRYDADNTANITSVDFAKSSTKKDDKLRPFIKHLYMQYDNLLPNTTARLGMTETLTFKPSEERWGFRSVAKTLMDGYKDITGVEIDATSADLGASFTGTLTKYFKYGFMVSNGSHYSHVETDKYKKYMLQAALVPLAGFSLVGYMDYEKQSDSAAAKTYKADANFEMVKNLTVTFEWFSYDNDLNKLAGGAHYDVRGWSLFGRYIVKPGKLTLFGRYDRYEPNTEVGDNQIGLVIAGFEWQPTDKAALKIQPNVWMYSYEHPDKKNDVVAVMTFFWSF